MRLGISSYTYGWAVGTDGNRPPNALGAMDLIDRASHLGVRVLQLCDNLPAQTFEDDSVEAISAKAVERGIQLEIGTRGIGQAHLTRMVQVAHRVGSGILRVVIDTAEDRPSPNQVADRLAKMTSVFANAGVVLAIENHDRFTVDELAGVIRQLGSPYVGICLDTANSFGAMEGPRAVVKTLGPYVVNLHLKDIAVKRFSHLQGFTIEGRPTGHGMLNVPWILDRLRSFGRDFNAIIEHWSCPAASMQETIETEACWAELSVKTVRQWIRE